MTFDHQLPLPAQGRRVFKEMGKQQTGASSLSFCSFFGYRLSRFQEQQKDNPLHNAVGLCASTSHGNLPYFGSKCRVRKNTRIHGNWRVWGKISQFFLRIILIFVTTCRESRYAAISMLLSKTMWTVETSSAPLWMLLWTSLAHQVGIAMLSWCKKRHAQLFYYRWLV